jgi:hypothetical protein
MEQRAFSVSSGILTFRIFFGVLMLEGWANAVEAALQLVHKTAAREVHRQLWRSNRGVISLHVPPYGGPFCSSFFFMVLHVKQGCTDIEKYVYLILCLVICAVQYSFRE